MNVIHTLNALKAKADEAEVERIALRSIVRVMAARFSLASIRSWQTELGCLREGASFDVRATKIDHERAQDIRERAEVKVGELFHDLHQTFLHWERTGAIDDTLPSDTSPLWSSE